MATITNSLASGSHTLLSAGELFEDIKAITFTPSSVGNTATVSLAIQEKGTSASFFFIRGLSIKGGNVFVFDNPSMLSYDKGKYNLLITTNQQTQVIVFT
jgi:hypothetical protein|tara:strand:+ start:913 stop:1212 length:300 start_codon:yes stop_codon:yes gene_type:complete